MGKRELFIAGAFVLISMIAYQLTAPAPRPGTRRFSWATVTDTWRRRATGPRGHAEVTTRGTLPLPLTASEISIAGATTVIVNGEGTGSAPAAVAWSLDVQAGGIDDDDAGRAAAAVTVSADDRGPVLALAVTGPPGPPSPGGRPASTLTLTVPPRMTVRIEGAMRTTVVGVAAVRLESLMGDTSISRVSGAITGSHRNGALRIIDAGTVALNTVASNATMAGVRGDTTVTMRNGACEVTDAGGAVTIDAGAGTVTVERSRGALRLTGNNGLFTVNQPRGDVRIDARAARVVIALDAAVPVTATTSDAQMRLALAGALPIDLDAAVEQGAITSDAIDLTPEARDGGARLRHRFGGGGRVTLRDTRGAIEIVRTK
jgi:hypothetical protein